jgi:hypothetical protein
VHAAKIKACWAPGVAEIAHKDVRGSDKHSQSSGAWPIVARVHRRQLCVQLNKALLHGIAEFLGRGLAGVRQRASQNNAKPTACKQQHENSQRRKLEAPSKYTPRQKTRERGWREAAVRRTRGRCCRHRDRQRRQRTKCLSTAGSAACVNITVEEKEEKKNHLQNGKRKWSFHTKVILWVIVLVRNEKTQITFGVPPPCKHALPWHAHRGDAPYLGCSQHLPCECAILAWMPRRIRRGCERTLQQAVSSPPSA